MRTLAIALFMLALTACGAAPTGNDSTGAASVAPSTPASAAPSAAPVPSSSPAASDDGSLSLPTGSAGAVGGTDDVERQATAFLAQQLNTAPETLTLQSREETEWSDSSLGCPDPATMYMQVITPGFKLTYSDGSKTYDLRTDSTGNRVVWCDNGQPKNIGQP